MNVILPKKKHPDPRVGIIIQARMTSSRFPGKSMASLGGKPVIQWVVDAARQVRPVPVNGIYLAIPEEPESEPLMAWAEANNVEGFQGSRDNVLERYYGCAKHYKLDVIVRVTGDCPFLNPRVSSEVLQLLLWRKLDYVSNCHPRTYPKGLDTEAFTFDCLEAAYVSTRDPYDKEHVTPWMVTTKGIKRGNTQQPIDTSELNWCVDYPEDIMYLDALLEDHGRGKPSVARIVRG